MRKIEPRRVRIITMILCLIDIGVMILGGCFDNDFIVKSAYIAIAVIILFYSLYYRCPHCGKFLGREKVAFCPHCGREVG